MKHKVEAESTFESQRQCYFTTFWCEQEYKNKYHVTYPWSGKDAKLLQRALSYMDSNVGLEQTHMKFEEAITNYLRHDVTFLNESKHPFSILAAKPHKYFTKTEKRGSSLPDTQRKPLTPTRPMNDEQWKQQKIKLKVFTDKIGRI